MDVNDADFPGGNTRLPGVKRMARDLDSLASMVELYWSTHSVVVCRGILHAAATLEGVETRGLGDQLDEQLSFLRAVGEDGGLEGDQELRELARTLIVRNLLPRVKADDVVLMRDVVRFFGCAQNCSGLHHRDLMEGLGAFIDRCGNDIARVENVSVILHLNDMVVNARYFTTRSNPKYVVRLAILADVYRRVMWSDLLAMPTLQWAGWQKLAAVEQAQKEMDAYLARQGRWDELHAEKIQPSRLVNFLKAQSEEDQVWLYQDQKALLEACVQRADASGVVTFVLECLRALQSAQKWAKRGY